MHTKPNADFYNERDNQSLVRHMHEFRNRRSNPLKPQGQVMPHRRYHQVKIATQMLPAKQMLSATQMLSPGENSHTDATSHTDVVANYEMHEHTF
ncbi:hypothetical protein QL285_069647 [Trifolium repens]|nr:hypothetical protein QL285_069647 [Trifolium repens]